MSDQVKPYTREELSAVVRNDLDFDEDHGVRMGTVVFDRLLATARAGLEDAALLDGLQGRIERGENIRFFPFTRPEVTDNGVRIEIYGTHLLWAEAHDVRAAIAEPLTAIYIAVAND